jgi:predicted Rossmann fold nucleotide-binding protein DprA/Smf involved in DNA uptake
MLSPLSPRNGAKSGEEKPVEPDPERPPYSVEESLVMLHVEDTGTSMDELVAKTGLSARKVNSIAMSLRLKGFVRFLPGNRIAPPR